MWNGKSTHYLRICWHRESEIRHYNNYMINLNVRIIAASKPGRLISINPSLPLEYPVARGDIQVSVD